jgi:hypothetical protein
MKILRMLALKAVLLGTLAAPLLPFPAYGQQEVDPTSYPLPEAARPAAHPAKQAKTASQGKHRATTGVRSELKKKPATVAKANTRDRG